MSSQDEEGMKARREGGPASPPGRLGVSGGPPFHLPVAFGVPPEAAGG